MIGPTSEIPAALHDTVIEMLRDAGLLTPDAMLLDLEHIRDEQPSQRALAERWGVTRYRVSRLLELDQASTTNQPRFDQSAAVIPEESGETRPVVDQPPASRRPIEGPMPGPHEPLPRWTDDREVALAVTQVVRTLKGAPKRGGPWPRSSDADALLGFPADLPSLELMARAFHECPHQRFADLRARGVERSIRTLCDLDAWADRFDAAWAWRSTPTTSGPRRGVTRRGPRSSTDAP